MTGNKNCDNNRIHPELAKSVIELANDFELCHSVLFCMKTTVCLKYSVNHCLWKQFLDSNSSHLAPSLVCLTISVNLGPMAQF